MKLRPAFVVVALVATVTACGGGAPAIYAGMAADEAASQGLRAAADEAAQPGHPLHGRDLRLARVVRGEDGGQDAWVVVLNVGKSKRTCVWIWADHVVLNVTYNYFIDKCTPKVLRAKADIVAS